MTERPLSRRQLLRRAAAAGAAFGLSPFLSPFNGLSQAQGAEHVGVLLANFPIMRQPDQISCGPTCCSMLLKYYGVTADVPKLKEIAGTRLFRMGEEEIGFTWPSRVQKALDEYGLPNTLRKQATLENVVTAIEDNRPPIILMRSSPKTWHYTVAIGHRQGKLFKMADPLGFTYWLTARTFQDAWSFDADLRGNPIQGKDCNVCGGNGKIGFAKCLVCGGNGHMPDMYRHIVQTNLLERVKVNTMIAPNRAAGAG